MHLSLSLHINELKSLINSFEISPEIIGITESKLIKSSESITNINLENYQIEHTPTEANNGGALLYINSNTAYKNREDLKIYKARELESIFVEILRPMEKNTIVGCIYRHPSMSVHEFNNNFLDVLLEKLTKENKNIILLGDFNINLLNYDNSSETAYFLNNMCSNALFPFITQPTRVTLGLLR